MARFPEPDVRDSGYLNGHCPNCGRVRLCLFVDGPEDDHRVVGIECEKCCAQWLLDPVEANFWGVEYRNNPLHPPLPENNPLGNPSASSEQEGR